MKVNYSKLYDALKFGTKTAWQDNSPYYHVLEIMKEERNNNGNQN